MLRKARLRSADDAIVELLEIAPARASRVGDRGDTRAQRERIGVDAIVAGIRPALACAGEDVHVNVDQAGRDNQACDVDHLERVGGIQARRDRRDGPALDGDIADRADIVLGVDHAATQQQQIVTGLRRQRARKKEEGNMSHLHYRERSITAYVLSSDNVNSVAPACAA
jgi:hypothetical protein